MLLPYAQCLLILEPEKLASTLPEYLRTLPRDEQQGRNW